VSALETDPQHARHSIDQDDIEMSEAEFVDPVTEAFKKDVDRTLLRENLALTPQQRSEKFLEFARWIYEWRGKANPGVKVWR